MYSDIFVSIVIITSTHGQLYDTFTGNEISQARYAEFERAGLTPWCAVRVPPCDPLEPRRSDHTCNNLQRPTRGAALTPYRRLLPPIFAIDGGFRRAKSGQPLPNARSLRVSLVPDGRIASHKYTQLLTHLNVYVIGDVSSVHDTVSYVSAATTCCLPVRLTYICFIRTLHMDYSILDGGEQDPNCIPIRVAPDDVHLRMSTIRCLNLTRATTYQRLGCVPRAVPPERLNTAAPMLEMSILYGHSSIGAMKGRELAGGRLRAELLRGREFPPSGSPFCINNQPLTETRCHDSPVSGANSLLGINVIFLWFYRLHNVLARSLQELNPCWSDEQLYAAARDINIAVYLQILYYQLMPLVLGKEYLLKHKVIFTGSGHVEDYDPTLEPGTSIEYIMGTRWFHIVQEGRLNMYTQEGILYQQLSIVDFTLRTGALFVNRTLEGITQGVFRQPCALNEPFVDPDMGERVLGRLQRASDVVSSDIMKGRDTGLPPYMEYRKMCGLPVAKKFEDMLAWINREQVEALGMAYERVDDVELMAGILAERPAPDALVGPTLRCIMGEQLARWRRADRFWYENTVHPGALGPEQLVEIRKATMSSVICQFGDDVTKIQPNPFLLPGPGNKMRSCSSYALPDLSPWADASCRQDNIASVLHEKIFKK